MLIGHIMKFLEDINAPKVGAFSPKGVTDKPLTGGVFVFTDMKKLCGIYKITSPSKKIYIGQSIDIKERWCHYKCLKDDSQRFLFNSFKKYGIHKHKFEIIQLCKPEELNDLEKYYIQLFQTFNHKHGLNLKAGGNGGGIISEDTRKVLSESHKGQIAHNKGKTMSKEQYEKCKNTMFQAGSVGIRKGVKLTQKHKEKLRIAHTGKKLSEEHKQNISNKLKGRPSKFKGVKRSAVLREKYRKLSENRKRNKYGQYV